MFVPAGPSWYTWQAWHVPFALAAVGLVLYLLARRQLARARDDWANAFFYAPSRKAMQRRRREQWQDRCWALLAIVAASLVVAGILYVRGPR